MGRLNDDTIFTIFKDILEERAAIDSENPDNALHPGNRFRKLLRNTEFKIVLIIDAGFARTKTWLEGKQATDPTFYQNVTIRIPHQIRDDTNRYTRDEADTSRFYVTSLRHVVENVHCWERTWKIHDYKVPLSFLRKNFQFMHVFIYASLNYFGYNRRTDNKIETVPPALKAQYLKGTIIKLNFLYIIVFVI